MSADTEMTKFELAQDKNHIESHVFQAILI